MTDFLSISAPALGQPILAQESRTLQLDAPLQAGRPAHVSAGSGLVVIGDTMFVTPDDENSLAYFRVGGTSPGRGLRAFAGDLPLGSDARGDAKPDLEASLVIPRSIGDATAGSYLLAIPSGSKTRRMTGVAFGVNARGQVDSAPKPLDLSPLMKTLAAKIPGKLNIEGAVATTDEVIFFHRGNSKGSFDATIRVPLAAVRTLLAGGKLAGDTPTKITRYELGALNGVKLTFSDATPLPDGRIIFLASAEGTKQATADGKVQGSAVGLLNKDGKVAFIRPLTKPGIKAEGVALTAIRDGVASLRLVTDADDINKPGEVLDVELPTGII